MDGAGPPQSLIDRARYPLDDPQGPEWHALVARCRAGLAEDGALSLDGFLTAGATEALCAESRAIAPRAYEIAEDHTVYFAPADGSVPAGHPRARLIRSVKGGVAYDHFPADSGLRALYEWDGLLTFIAGVLGADRLYRHADPMAALNLNIFAQDQNLNWHFDRSDFSVTLSLQAAAEGGDFEYLPGLRSEDDENHEGVARVLDGDLPDMRRLSFEPGTLAVFCGHFALHRVTPVVGPTPRIAAVFCFVHEPGVTFTPYARKLFYGREQPADHSATRSRS